MTYEIIATGSSGNAVLINGNILVDCGVPFVKLGPYIGKIKLVLCTHRHSDHFNPSTAKTLHYMRPGIRFLCAPEMAKDVINAGIDLRRIDIIDPGQKNRLCYYGLAHDGRATFIEAFPLTHNVPNIGYKIQIGDERVFYATDTGTLDGITAKDYDLYLIEANHTKAGMLARVMKKLEAGEFAYEYKAAENHLSLEQATDWLLENVGPNSEYQFLHQHKGDEEDADE